MSAVSSLVPARFLTMMAHLVIVITIFWSRENNVKACLPLDYTQADYENEDRKLVVALAVTIGMFAIELAGFFSGVSMFNCSQGLLCILFTVGLSYMIKHGYMHSYSSMTLNSAAIASSPAVAIGVHASASVALLFFLFEQWECEIYWSIFAICSVLPAVVEILLFIAVFGLKKKPL